MYSINSEVINAHAAEEIYAQMVFNSIHYGATVFSKVINAVCIIFHFFIYLDAIRIT